MKENPGADLEDETGRGGTSGFAEEQEPRPDFIFLQLQYEALLWSCLFYFSYFKLIFFVVQFPSFILSSFDF